MKTNIITYEIDENKLRKEILDFESITNQHAYIIMNQKTADVLEKKYNPCIIGSKDEIEKLAKKLKDKHTIAVYDGNKIVIDDDLEFGEVDIR